MKKLGCLFFIVILAVLAVEGWVLTLVADWWRPGADSEYFGAILVLIGLSIFGVTLVRKKAASIMPSVMAGDFGGAAVGLLGGILIIIPGFITGAIGLLAQLPPVQKMFAKTAGTIMGAVIRQMVGRMGGQMPGMGAGMPGGFPGGFPGMPTGGLTPDESIPKPHKKVKGGRTFDVRKE